MPTETPQPIYLKDYKPPAWLIEEVSLDVRLEPETTKVASRLLVTPNPRRAGDTVHLELDGERLTLQEVGIDGSKLNPDQYAVNPEKLVVRKSPSARSPSISSPSAIPSENRAQRALYVQRHLLHPMRSRRISTHNLLSRPAGCHGALPGAHRGGEIDLSGPPLERQPDRGG